MYAGAICFVLLFILNKNQNLNNYIFSRIDAAFLIYIFAFSISRFFNSGIGDAVHIFFRLCQDYFVYVWVAFFLCKNEKHAKLICCGILIAAGISVFYGMLQYFHFDYFHRQADLGRLSGFHKNSYTYGGQLIILFFFLFNEWYKNGKRIIWLFFSALCFLCILNTSERAVMLGVFAGLVLYLICERINRKDLLSCLFFLMLPVFITMRFHRKVFKRIKNVVNTTPNHLPNIRLKLWGIALSIWKRNILFGAGKFPVVAYQRVDYLPIQYLKHAHSVYFQILVTNGMVGLIAFLNLIYSFLRVIVLDLKTNRYANSLLSVILAFLIEGIFEYFWGDSEVRYFLLYFIGFVIGNSMLLNPEKV